MPAPLRFCLVLHDHQPIGNFDSVFEQAYADSYLPFLEVFEQYPDLRLTLHTSGPLAEWLDERRPEYFRRLDALVRAGRVEILGGPFYEPILTMIPPRDRVAQITTYTRWLEDRFAGRVRGMWMPERVWEQSLASDLATAGMRYTLLDDFHFRNAGLEDDELYGHYVTEDDGRLLSVFPGSERLRYLIPFGQPHETIDYLRAIADKHANAVLVFGDDGEKFGVWPETKQHVYHNGWLRNFFDALVANKDWLHTTTLGEAVDNTPPLGKIYLPDASYREMTEWALPVGRQLQYDDAIHDLQNDPRFPAIRQFMRGGAWRNFKVKYPETNDMYSRMMMVSRRLDQLAKSGLSEDELRAAQRELHRGQCNCGYWHGAFGGIYLPHLRNAVYNHLIAADNLMDSAAGKAPGFVEATADDFNFDARQEVRLASDKLVCLAAPAAGGQIYELDVRTICHNLGATLARRPEAYHRRVLAGAGAANGNLAAISEKVIFKQPGLDQRVQYDRHLRRSLVDHFYDEQVSLDAVRTGEAMERGDFVHGVYDARLRRSSDRVQALFTRSGNAWGHPLRITKGITLEAGGASLEISYVIEGLPENRPLHFAVEFNLAGLPAGADDRYFHRGQRTRLGQLGTVLDLRDAQDLSLADEWLGLDVGLTINRPSGLWAFPVETVSQSEGGFELVHQSVVVQPHWLLTPDSEGRWSVTMTLAIDTRMAESRMARHEPSLAAS